MLGVSWGSLGGPGSDLDDKVNVLVVGADGRLYAGGWNVYAGGEFGWAGDKPSSKIGCYTGATPAGILSVDDFGSGDTGAWSE